MTEEEKHKIIYEFLDELQERYSLNEFCPAAITLSKNGDTLFARVPDGNGEIILDRWVLEEFKDKKVY